MFDLVSYTSYTERRVKTIIHVPGKIQQESGDVGQVVVLLHTLPGIPVIWSPWNWSPAAFRLLAIAEPVLLFSEAGRD